MAADTSYDADVLIVGAGPAGLALACALSDAGISCLLVEQQGRELLDQPQEDGREIALTHRARRVMQQLGLWAHLDEDADVALLNEARVIDGSSPQVLHFGADASAGTRPLGWLAPNHRIRRAAWLAAAARPGITVRDGARVMALDRDPAAATLALADGTRLRGRLVVAADSRFSTVRRMAGIGAAMHDFGRTVVVAPVAHEHDHQGIAWECFRYGNTLALLPMTGRRVSAVVTLPSDRAPEWLALSDTDFAARIEQQSERRLGAVQAAGPRHHYPLVGVYAQRFVAPRFALIGDAAVGMHPVTAHGWNFGLYGVEVLARELAAARRRGIDIGRLDALRAYEQEHRRETLPVWLGTNAVVTLFTDDRRLPKLARRAVLAVAERAPLLSQLVKRGIEGKLTSGGARA